jgi:hypothetical protein
MNLDEKIAFFFTPPARITEPGSFSSLFMLRREIQDCLIGNGSRNRHSFADAAHSAISDPKVGLASLEDQLNTPEGFRWYRQRMFYRSSVALYRSFQLFLAFLALERRYFRTWAGVTGYYSRFYFIQALLNLLFSSWLELDRAAVAYDGGRVKCYRQKDLERLSHRFRKGGSHEIGGH